MRKFALRNVKNKKKKMRAKQKKTGKNWEKQSKTGKQSKKCKQRLFRDISINFDKLLDSFPKSLLCEYKNPLFHERLDCERQRNFHNTKLSLSGDFVQSPDTVSATVSIV